MSVTPNEEAAALAAVVGPLVVNKPQYDCFIAAGVEAKYLKLNEPLPTDVLPSCRAPGHRCVDMRDCYTSKCCQYQPDDSDA